MDVVLQLSDITRVTGLPTHTARQWTLGRPYAIASSVRESRARGVPKLFDAADALRFAVAAQLTHDGFTSRVIKAALAKLDTHAETLEIAPGRIHSWTLIPSDVVARVELDKKLSAYVLNLGRLRAELHRKIAARPQTKGGK